MNTTYIHNALGSSMKKLLLIVVLLLISPTAAQTPELLVHDGDEFVFVIKTWKSDSPDIFAGYMVSGEVSEGSAVVTMKEGDTFTLRIINATPIKENGDSYILAEFTVHGMTLQIHETLEFGGVVVYPDWDSYRAEISADSDYSTSDSGFSHTITRDIIDTSSEFGSITKSKVTYEVGDGTLKGSSRLEIRYSKTEGVMNYLSQSASTDGAYNGTTTTTSIEMVIQRQGYNLPDDGPSIALPAYQLLWAVPAMIAIGVIRRRIYT